MSPLPANSASIFFRSASRSTGGSARPRSVKYTNGSMMPAINVRGSSSLRAMSAAFSRLPRPHGALPVVGGGAAAGTSAAFPDRSISGNGLLP